MRPNPEGYIAALEEEISYWKKEVKDYKLENELIGNKNNSFRQSILTLLNLIEDMLKEDIIASSSYGELLKGCLENKKEIWDGTYIVGRNKWRVI